MKAIEASFSNPSKTISGTDLVFTDTTVKLFVSTGPEDDMLSYRISGIRNPKIVVQPGSTLHIYFVNTDSDMKHDFRIGKVNLPFSVTPTPSTSVGTSKLSHEQNGKFSAEELTIRVPAAGEYLYFCDIGGHAKGGMWGKVIVSAADVSVDETKKFGLDTSHRAMAEVVEESHVVERSQVSVETKNVVNHSFEMIISSYLKVKNALTKDKTDIVIMYAKELLVNINTLEENSLSPEQRIIWKQNGKQLTDDATALGNSKGLEDQRKAFESLSSHFYTTLKALNINSIDLFYQYCPMADAYWVSEKSTIANPYYGKQMSSCGSTKETIKAVIR